MKRHLTPAAGRVLCLTVLMMVCCTAVIVVKALLPASILPRITFSLLIALSLASLVLDRWIFSRDSRPEYLESGLLAMAAFAVMTHAVGLADLSGAGRVGIAGGIVYTLCLLVFTAMDAQLESTAVRHKRAALTLAAALLLLASQGLAGIPIPV